MALKRLPSTETPPWRVPAIGGTLRDDGIYDRGLLLIDFDRIAVAFTTKLRADLAAGGGADRVANDAILANALDLEIFDICNDSGLTNPSRCVLVREGSGDGGRAAVIPTYRNFASVRRDLTVANLSAASLALDGLTVLRSPAEARDAIATIATDRALRGLPTLICNTDDMLYAQTGPLVDILAWRGAGRRAVLDHATIARALTFDPSALPDYRALTGDAERGLSYMITPRRATEYLVECGSLELLLARAHGTKRTSDRLRFNDGELALFGGDSAKLALLDRRLVLSNLTMLSDVVDPTLTVTDPDELRPGRYLVSGPAVYRIDRVGPEGTVTVTVENGGGETNGRAVQWPESNILANIALDSLALTDRAPRERPQRGQAELDATPKGGKK